MADTTTHVLEHLAECGPIDSLTLAVKLGTDHQRIVGAVKSLQSLGNVITAEQRSSKQWELTKEGEEVVEKGSHEALVYYNVPEEGISQKELMQTIPNAKVGFSKAMSAGWLMVDKTAEGGPKIRRKVDKIHDDVQECLLKFKNMNIDDIIESQKQDFKKRKLLQEVTVKSYWLEKGPQFSLTVEKQETDLTPEMIATGSWKEKKFKPYNFDALGVPLECGHLHPLMKVKTEVRQIFLEMGFTEMATNNYVESSFWNFDTLFVPQKHPARDMQDTFYLSDPVHANEFPLEYLERVETVHSVGGYGSQGYNYEWKFEETKKNVMRTHTTAVSARMLYRLAQQKKFIPVKYFSIDKVFRNENLDATHLAEFHQVEGVVADYGLTLGNLMGLFKEFFNKLGIRNLRFKPTYNPYTEPSMEIFSYHEGLKKWVEVGNSGMFRPEMLLPMGLPKDVAVLAWGLSLERPTMIKYGIDNIRELVGHKVNLKWFIVTLYAD
ncbi:phenylalanine--tRNA ligase alpha subunit-like [Limulus polyphemus]|uniref:Phenylalanine--tRNA ligase alpha subunit n=1 Tax=Limulus polyphemus TaxID=6850 RepID=A0ABM1TJK7_LIMPO|nr:phenylalanine--tRNA ligase alpha subunit-like [Limulus polyphemus]